MAEGGSDFLRCQGEAYERMRALSLPNHLALQDAARTAVEGGRRLLEFERYVDRLEERKREEGELPRGVEGRAGQAFERALGDARTMAAAVVEAAGEFQDVGAFDELLAETCRCLERAGEVSADQALEQAMPVLEREVSARGVPTELWRWAVPHIDMSGIILTCEEGKLIAQRGDHRLAIVRQNPAFLPVVDGTTFAEGELYRRYRKNPDAVIDGVPHESTYGGITLAAKALLERVEVRGHRTALDGIQVQPTGIDPLTIVLIIAMLVFVISLVILILCGHGVIKKEDPECQLAGLLITLALFIICAMSFCTITIGDEELEPPVG